MEGDFLKGELPSSDLYALARILHDWPPETAKKLLSKVFHALDPGGVLLIGEKLLNEDKRGPYWAQMQHLNMLTIAEGRERTFTQYRTLLHEAGFAELMAAVTDGPLDFIRAVKPDPQGYRVNFGADIDVKVIQSDPPQSREVRLPFEQEAEMYFSFFEDAPVGFVISRLDGQLVLVNKAYADILGRSVEETLHMTTRTSHPQGMRKMTRIRWRR